MTSAVASSAGVDNSPTLDTLERLVGEIGDLQSKLILLVGNGGKTRLLRTLAQRLNAAPFNLGVELGHRLAATPVSERGFSANELLRELTDHLGARQPAPLPDLPFPGQHRASPRRESNPARALVAAVEALG